MPYMAVQCFKCHMLQVKQVRKSSSTSKWSCAICNEKQSVRKVYTTSNSPQEVRKFVQKYNLSKGLAEEADAMARLEGSDDQLEVSPEDHYYQEAEEEPVEEEVPRRVGVPRQHNTSKWKQFLGEEDQVCSGDLDNETADDKRFVTTLPDPPSRTRKYSDSNLGSFSSRLPKRAQHDSVTTSSEAPKSGSFRPRSSMNQAANSSGPDILNSEPNHDAGYDRTSRCQTWNLSAVPEGTSSSQSASDGGSSPKNVKSCHAQVPVAKTSKWSKYLT